MSHLDAVAVGKSDGIARLYGLSIDGGQVLVLIVAEYGFQRSIGQGCDGDTAVLTAHIAVGGVYLYGGFRGVAFPADDILSFSERIGFAVVF